MNITVYLGANFGINPNYRAAARGFGQWIGESGNRLIYGGSRVGCMGILADAVLEAGGEVVGVEPQFMIERELQHNGITELITVETMAERMTKMIELGEAFVALPGGLGTLEEISEVASRVRLGLTVAPCVLYNVEGYYNNLERFIQHMLVNGFVEPESFEKIDIVDTLEEVIAAIGA